MNKSEYKNKIEKLKLEIEFWDIALEEYTKADFVMGYYLNPQTKKYDVYINNERGRQRIRKTTENELEGLDKLVSMMEFESKTQKQA